MKTGLLLALLLSSAPLAAASSVYTTRLDDPKAVYLAPQPGSDDAARLQAAIDKAEGGQHEGLVFIAAGQYRLAHTVYVWPGVRLIGWGATRPVFLLPPHTPGFQDGMGVMVMFTGLRPGEEPRAGGRIPFPPSGQVPPNANIADANSSTFYSAMSNIDFEMGDGNPAAVAIRFHVAQHAFLTHMDFRTGSGLAALYQVGNEAEDLHFHGGRYGILTEKTSPAWQFTLVDSTFDGQREAAIREHEAGLTLVRDTFERVATAIDIDEGYPDQLWARDCRFDDVSQAAVTISDEQSPLVEIGFENARLQEVPTFAKFRESGKTVEGKGFQYIVKSFNYGLIVPALGEMGNMGMRYDAEALTQPPPALPAAIPALPPTSEWVNVHTLGVKGDGVTDDTSALKQAIAAHRVLYLPSGHYVVRDTLELRPDTVLIGLHPTLTQIDLLDSTAGFQGVGSPRAVLLAPEGGRTMLSGFGVFTGGINPRAVGVLWQAGEASLIDDVRFLGGHGSGTNPYNNDHTADPDLHKRWDSQYPSLWVYRGGGTFADIWTPNTFAQAGLLVEHTSVPGHIYEFSNEHHVRTEIRFDHVENWDVNAPQTEEEAGESPDALSLEMDWSHNVTIANYHAYRVTRSRAPYPTAVRLYHSSDIHFRNVHVNAESGYAVCDDNGCGTFLRLSKYPYENAIEDMTHHLFVREREFAVLDIPADPPTRSTPDASAVLRPDATVRKLEDGFFSIAGAAIEPSTGRLFFVDRHEQRIYSWDAKSGLNVERDNALDPVNLAFDGSGNLLVLSSAGPQSTVYTFHPGAPEAAIEVLAPQPLPASSHAAVLLPVNWWNNGEFQDQLDLKTLRFTTLAELFAEDATTPRKQAYVSPDGSVFLPAGRVFQQGPANDTSGWRFSDNLDTYGFITAKPGAHVYVSSESEDVTYNALVHGDGTLGELKPFAQRGGESVAVDAHGNVYVANGQVFVYDPAGKQIARIDVPERPLQLIFGGEDRKTLFILAHHALFSVEVR